MTKSKASVERKIQNNRNNPISTAESIEMNFKKSTKTEESAKLSGLGTGKD